ncbi:site-specific DNA-methyltransferase [Streptomyces olivoreticuli]
MDQSAPAPGGDLKSGPQPAADAQNTPLLPLNTILVGDVRKKLRELPASAVDCIITSPPYFGVRDYGHDEQLGAEESVEAWVNDLRSVCHELARVLRPTGSLWLNLGDGYSRRPSEGARPKSLLLGPARLAMALCADGWVLRNQVVWAKSNPMPSSIGDRLTTAHESVYFFVRSRSYYFNLDAIRQPLVTTTRQAKQRQASSGYPPSGTGLPQRKANDNRGLVRLRDAGVVGHPLGKNPGDVWSLPTAGYRGAHFAVFPSRLVERPLLATCPERVCSACGAAWQRELERRDGRLLAVGLLQPACICQAEGRPGVVLDPFMGSGTTALVAEQHGRHWIGIELNPAYAHLATERLRKARQKRAMDTGAA